MSIARVSMMLLGLGLGLLPVLAAACLEGDPNPVGQSGTSGTSGTPGSSGFPVGSSGSPAPPTVQPTAACSGPGTQAVTLTFKNQTADRSIDLLWVDQQCTEVRYATLGPGASHVQPTFVGHVWRMRDTATHALYKEYVPRLALPAEVTVP
jgi:hypothetical protein